MSKHESLKRLKELGFKVPEFFVITHDEILKCGNPELLKALNSALESSHHEQIYHRALAFINSVQVPKLTSKDTAYAVRSSSSMEDSESHSFAGIFETKLFVKNLEEAIKEVWLSLYSDKSLGYCKDRQLSFSTMKMNVVIQEMIDADKAGVLFQANPTGTLSEQVIVAGFGAGQGIVDDETDTDRYVIENFEIKESEITEKKFCLRYNGNELVKTELPSEKQNISVLTQQEIEKLLTVSVKLSMHYEHYMDVEYCFKDSDLYLLQARPITTIPGKKFISIFDNSNIAENYPGVSLPLTFSGLSRGYAANFKRLLRFVGFNDEDWQHINNNIDQLTGYWGGQIYYNLNHWYSLYALLPFGAEKAVASFNEMVGINSGSVIQLPSRSLWQKLRLTFRLLPKFSSFYFDGKSYHRAYKKDFTTLYERFTKNIEGCTSAFEAIKLIQSLDNDYFGIIKIPLFNDFFSSILNSSCRKLAIILLPNGEQVYNDLLSSREDLESSRAIYSLIELSELVSVNRNLFDYLSKSTAPHKDFQDFFDKLQKHFDRYGDRSQWEMKIETPTAREIPETTIKLILQYASEGMSQNSQRLKEKEKAESARKAFKAVSLRKPFTYLVFQALFKKCTLALAFREDSRFDRVRIKGLSRKLALKLGDYLVASRTIKEKEDLFYLTFDEITSLIHDSYGQHYWQELISLRKRHLDELRSLKLPDRIVVNSPTSVKNFAIRKDAMGSDSISGIPCSGGQVEAECVVVSDLHTAPSLAGKILVAERTDPSWGYFFVGVKGIIIEKGSMLSHAAIISRELGIPCIINVKHATEIFKTGAKIQMNGDTGEIKVVRP